MYTVSKGPSKIVAKTRRGLSQNFEKFETIKQSGKRNKVPTSPTMCNIPRPVFHSKKYAHNKAHEQPRITAHHEEIIKYINDSWNIIAAKSGISEENGHQTFDDNNNNNNATSPQRTIKTYINENNSNGNGNGNGNINSNGDDDEYDDDDYNGINDDIESDLSNLSVAYCNEAPSPMLDDFKPFDLEAWWGRRLFQNITKNA